MVGILHLSKQQLHSVTDTFHVHVSECGTCEIFTGWESEGLH